MLDALPSPRSSPRSSPLVVVPLRAGKSRLADALDAPSRSGLRAAMLADVAAALRGAGLAEIVVAAGDEESATMASDLGLEVHRDPPSTRDLNDAIDAAASLVGPDADVLVVTADLPGLSVADVEAVLRASGPVVLAPTADGGTGALLRRPRSVLRTAYGWESAARHAARCLDAGIRPVVLDLPGCRVDLDTPEDLEALTSPGPATAAWLASRRAA